MGLSYITVGQNATTLSGGEAKSQLAKDYQKDVVGGALYILMSQLQDYIFMMLISC